MLIIDVLYNLAVLIAICVVSGFIDNRFSRSTLRGKLLQGLLFGLAAAVGMIFPYAAIGDAIFDARTVVISTGTLFFGPLAGVIAMGFAIIARVYIGGAATLAGIVVISLSFAISYGFYVYQNKRRAKYSVSFLFLMGLLVHLAMLAVLYTMLSEEAFTGFFGSFASTVIVFYPLATILIGKVLNDHFTSKGLIDQLKLSEEILSVSLSEKKVLLSEIHHRVKNNLAIISSLLSLESDTFSNPETRTALEETESRIRSMALIHELIYSNENYNSIDFSMFLHKLDNVITSVFSEPGKTIETEIHSENIYLDLNTSIPCALIVNELFTNAYKHAFKNRTSGKISIHFSEKDGMLEFIMQDNGVGMDNPEKLLQSSSFGITIINGLVEQLQGTIQVSGGKEGLKSHIRFPKKD
ncbi:MAG: ATP-binding protein [Balneolales bacterium]|nr:ATP-binding protein [Balneolales bacterium]